MLANACTKTDTACSGVLKPQISIKHAIFEVFEFQVLDDLNQDIPTKRYCFKYYACRVYVSRFSLSPSQAYCHLTAYSAIIRAWLLAEICTLSV